MAKKTGKKAPAPDKTDNKSSEKYELVAGRFRPGSDLARMYQLLADGKPRTVPEIQKVVKARVEKNIGVGKYASLSAWGKQSGKYEMAKVEGKITLTKKKE